MDTRQNRMRITIELTPEVKRGINQLPHGIRGKVLFGIATRLAKEIEANGWESVLWLSHGDFSFIKRRWANED